MFESIKERTKHMNTQKRRKNLLLSKCTYDRGRKEPVAAYVFILVCFCRRGKYVLNAQFPCLIKNAVRSIKREVKRPVLSINHARQKKKRVDSQSAMENRKENVN